MSPEEIERFRIRLLQQLRQVTPSTLPLDTLRDGARYAGFGSATDDITRAALAYLGDKGFVAVVPKPLSPECKRWRITAAGIDMLAEAGL
jgi:hypothetical protein